MPRRWNVVTDEGEVNPQGRDATAYLWGIQSGEDVRHVTVFISGTAMQSSDGTLPPEVVAAKQTRGRSVLDAYLEEDEPPRQVMVTTERVSTEMPD